MKNNFQVLINKLESEFMNDININDKINVIKSYLNNQLFDENKTNELNNLKEKLIVIKQNRNQTRKKKKHVQNEAS